ncbi:MAG: hypothetical protein PHI13_09940, partial [Methylococcales bacterium]|nr:hypothetical protein [Methylococcales bacterium]
MTATLHDDSVFSKPEAPENSWQLLYWIVFEPVLLERYSEKLNKKQTLSVFLKAYCCVVLIALAIYLVGCFVIAAADTPTLFSTHYETEFVDNYRMLTGFEQKFFFIVQKSIVELAVGLAGGLAVGLVFGLASGLASGLAFGLAFWLAFGLAVGLAFGLASGLTNGLTNGLASGLASGLTNGLTNGLSSGLAVGLGFYFSYFRLCFYPLYSIRSLFGVNFYASPYHKDAMIWLPLWGVEKQFRRLALATPEDALKFVRFLREYRPLQSKLADCIAHAACAGTWLNHPLAFESLEPPLIENDKLQPSDNWLKQLQALKGRLVAYRQQMQLSLKQEYFQRFLKQLDAFNAQTLVEHKRWRDEYLQALALWQKVALEEQQKLAEQAQQQEPITANVYMSGEALRPDTNYKVFLGRDDLKDELARRIYSSQQMPLFLFQGQRRVGKTSLLNFLEQLLVDGFKVVYQDLQGARVSSIQTWLADLQARISEKLSLPAKFAVDDFLNDDWLTAWQRFETWLQTLSLDNSYKLILAFDEYEELHRLLQANPEQGARLLAAM